MIAIANYPKVGRIFYKVVESDQDPFIIMGKFQITFIAENSYHSECLNCKDIKQTMGKWDDYLNDTPEKAKLEYLEGLRKEFSDLANYVLDMEYTDEIE